MQQMIQSIFSFSSVCVLDFGSSNHMAHSSDSLARVKQYGGGLKIHTADGEPFPITVVGNIPHSY